MTKIKCTIARLLNLLVIAQNNMPGNKGKATSFSFGKSKNKKGNKKKKTSTLGPYEKIAKNQYKNKKKTEAVADKGKCFHCQKKRH